MTTAPLVVAPATIVFLAIVGGLWKFASLERSSAPDFIKEDGERVAQHLQKWIRVLSTL